MTIFVIGRGRRDHMMIRAGLPETMSFFSVRGTRRSLALLVTTFGMRSVLKVSPAGAGAGAAPRMTGNGGPG